MTKRKIIFSIIMTLVFCIMTLGYAALQQKIDIEGQADIDSTYRVEITRVTEGSTTGDARSTAAPQYSGLSASFYVGLTNTTDVITYNIEITNYSTVDIRLNNLEINTTNNNMKVTKVGISNGDIMLAGSTKTFTVKIKLTDATSSEQTATITVNPEFTRLKGGTGSVVEEVHDTYEIGDIISFAGSNWYVIEDSPSSSDYITLLKKNVLTASEITSDYAYNSGNTMGYYWSDTCHQIATYGTVSYDTKDTSGCNGHSDYAGSKIKKMLEQAYLPTLGISNLKEVDGYKIRLIKLDDLTNNLGYVDNNKTVTTPSWVYGVGFYWTMSNINTSVIFIGNGGGTSTTVTVSLSYRVRPVINLYKSAVE